MSSYVYLITEGVHDVTFLGGLLRRAYHFEQVQKVADLDPHWKPLLPSYPYQGGLRGAVPAPYFYRSPGGDTTIAVVNAVGISEIKKKLHTQRDALDRAGVVLDAVGVVLDADSTEPPERRFAETADTLAAEGLPRPATVKVVTGSPRVGVFILPGEGAPGTLEDILLECGAVVYPTLRDKAAAFVDGVDRGAAEFVANELKDLGKPAGRQKAVIAAMGAILKPGRAIQTTLEDHRWIEPRTLALPRVAALTRFIGELIGASPSATNTL